MKTNKKVKKSSVVAAMPKIKYGKPTVVKNATRTAEGAPAYGLSSELQLRRSVLSTFLGEDQAYEGGGTLKDRIAQLVPLVKPEIVAELAIQARNEYNLRHAPLFLAREMARHPEHRVLVSYVLDNVIKRADEIAEFVSIYWANGKCPLSNQVKIGLANAFNRFSEFDFAKYNQDNAVKLRDVMFLVHPRPDDITKARSFSKQDRKKGKKRPASDKEVLFNKIAQNTLDIPDTWEVRLSASNGEGKRKIWEEFLDNGKLGGLAFLKNLRNMVDAGVNRSKVVNYFQKANFSRVLPFRFLSALKHAPDFAAQLESSMLSCLDAKNKLGGRTALLVDISQSMDAPLSQKSENNRVETAYALAILAREMFADVDVYTFSSRVIKMRGDLRGFALRDAMHSSQGHGSTDLGEAVKIANRENYDRVIVFTDEQSQSKVDDPKNVGYMINVASAKNGVGYGKWVHIDGFSEAVVDFIREIEAFNNKYGKI